MKFTLVTGHIFINGEIGDPIGGTTVKSFKDQINQQANEHFIHINSVGGDVYDGYQIGFMIRSMPNTTAIIEGQCASIATYIALSANKVIMNPHGDFMIHYPTVNTQGRADDLRQTANQLDRIKNEIIDRYMVKVAKKGITREQLDAMMNEETSMSAQEAFDKGFVDEIKERLKAVAKFDITKFTMNINDEQKTWFEKKFEDLANMFKTSKFRPKNVAMTLEDGTVIMIMSEEGPAQGVTVTKEDGTPIPAGQYTTVEGITITVDENSTITQVQEMAQTEDAASQIAAKDKEIEELKTKLAAQETASTESQQQAQVEISNMKKEMEELRTQFVALQKTPFGDGNKPNPGDPNKQQQAEKQFDPMAEAYGNAWVSRR